MAFLYKRRVQFAETDLAGMVHFSCMFRYMEEAEHALWRAAGMSVAAPDATYGWPRVSASFDYRNPLHFEEEFEVAVRIDEVSRRSIRFAFDVTRGDTPIGSGTLTAVCVTKTPGERLRSMEIPADVVTRLREAVSASWHP
jgi:acyl-CoA thioester hydrolase